MEVLIEILTVICCVLLILVVLVQDSKGGGLSSSFGGSNQILGVRQTTDFLEKATWFLAIALLVFSLLSAYFSSSSNNASVQSGPTSIAKQRADNMSVPAPMQPAPDAGTSQPAGGQGGSTPAPANK